MSYANFKPQVWSREIITELHKQLCFKSGSDFKYVGEIKKGNRVKILGIGSPNVKDYKQGKAIDSPESLADASIYLDIEEAKYFNVGVDDIDNLQKKGLLTTFANEAATIIAEKEDIYSAKKIALGSGNKLGKLKITTKEEAKTIINAMFTKIYTNNVSVKQKLQLYLTPEIYELLYDYIVELKTNNDNTIVNGIVGTYKNATVHMTNCIYNDGEHDHIVLKTPKSYAFAEGINELKAYEPHDGFNEAIKGLCSYGGVIVKPKEIVTAQVSY